MGFIKAGSPAEAALAELTRCPEAVETDSIIEATFEVRLARESEALEEVLPGMLFKAEAFDGDKPKVDRLPIASLPTEIRRKDENLRFKPSIRMSSGNLAYAVGSQTLSCTVRAPYIGWKEFRKKISCLIEVAEKVIDKDAHADRFSLLYQNFIPYLDASHTAFEPVTLSLSADNYDFSNHTQAIRTELDLAPVSVLMNLSSRVKILDGHGNESESGLLLNVDAIRQFDAPCELKRIAQDIDELHIIEKRAFFGLLTDDAYAAMGPKD